MRRAPVLAACLAVIGLVASAAPAAAAAPVDRVAGGNQYETAIAVSQRTVRDPALSSRVAVLVSGDDAADVLAAPSVAINNDTDFENGNVNAPILMVPTGQGLPREVEAELRRLELTTLYILGGTNKVSRAAQDQARAFVPTVERIAGADRYETAVKVSQRYATPGGVVVITTGESPTDALPGVKAAGGGTLLLTRKDSLPAATANELKRLRPTRVLVVGGTGVVSTAVRRAVEAAATGAVVTRIGGADRYATDLAVTQQFDVEPFVVVLTSGETWQNAVVAGAFSVSDDVAGTRFLTKRDCVPSATVDYITSRQLAVTVVGGPGNVSDAAANLTRC